MSPSPPPSDEGVIRYVVVSRKRPLSPLLFFPTPEEAAQSIRKAESFTEHAVRKWHPDDATGRARPLDRAEKLRVDRALFPGLHPPV